jgi:hypothetical protein
MKLICSIIFAMTVITGCHQERQKVMTGRVVDSISGEGLDGALLTTLPEPSIFVTSSKDGYFVLEGLSSMDTILVTREGYETTRLFAADHESVETIRRDIYLRPVADTAYTSSGPVDASLFLENEQLKRKKLSLNEGRRVATATFPMVRFRKGSLVKVNNLEEWMFEGVLGHAQVVVYINALTGEIRSVESDDILTDRRLQELLNRDL